MPVVKERSDGSWEKVLLEGEEYEGTEFPSDPYSGQLFYKTHTGAFYYYDSSGSEWVEIASK